MSHPSQLSLIGQRRFGPFFLTQLTGAFNDNLFKQILVLLVTYQAAKYTTLSSGVLVNMAAGLFMLPFLLFSALGGQLADRFDKAILIKSIKACEIGILGVASYGFYTHGIEALMTALFLMGCHSAFFGPVKYSILPQVLKESELVGGNGLLESATFMAILAGTLCAGLIVAATTDPLVISCILLTVAILGFVASLAVPKTGSSDPSLKVSINLPKQTWEIIKLAKKNRPVWLGLLGISWFWFFGAMFLSQLPVLGKETLHGSEEVVTTLLGVFSIGVALGSLFCERLSSGRVELGLVPFGSIGLSVFALDIYFASKGIAPASATLSVFEFLQAPGSVRILMDIALLGLFGGFYIVPLYALVQSRGNKAEQSRVIAANNVLNSLFMVVAAGVGAGLVALGATVPQMIGICGLFNVLVAAYIYGLLPEFLWRFVAWLVIHTVYRVKVVKESEIPEQGAALLCPNHVSYLDALVLSAAAPRPIRFVMENAIFKTPVLGSLFRAAGAIPICSAKEDPAVREAAYVAIAKALQDGELVCLFPEGALTRTGALAEFKPGALKIANECQVPVFPVGIKGLEGSLFSKCSAPKDSKLFNRLVFRKIVVRVGPVLSVGPDTSVEELKASVQRLL